jgi:hypothetical protein
MTTRRFRPASSWLLGASFLCGGALACGHSHAVGDTQAASPGDKSPRKEAEHDADRSHDEAKVPARVHSRDKAPPLATSPAGLLKPDAIADIQAKLVSRGRLAKSEESGKLDGPTHAALRSFQGENNLPATGMPDDLTVQKLGLRPDQVFRATPQGASSH